MAFPIGAYTPPNNASLSSADGPLPRGKFVLTKGDWEIDPSTEYGINSFEPRNKNNEYSIRRLIFISYTPGSLFNEASIFGYRDGTLAIEVKGINSELIEKCFLEHGIHIDSGNFGLSSSEPATMRKLLGILEQHNEIPENELSLIRQLVESGNWKHVCMV